MVEDGGPRALRAEREEEATGLPPNGRKVAMDHVRVDRSVMLTAYGRAIADRTFGSSLPASAKVGSLGVGEDEGA